MEQRVLFVRSVARWVGLDGDGEPYDFSEHMATWFSVPAPLELDSGDFDEIRWSIDKYDYGNKAKLHVVFLLNGKRVQGYCEVVPLEWADAQEVRVFVKTAWCDLEENKWKAIERKQ